MAHPRLPCACTWIHFSGVVNNFKFGSVPIAVNVDKGNLTDVSKVSVRQFHSSLSSRISKEH